MENYNIIYKDLINTVVNKEAKDFQINQKFYTHVFFTDLFSEIGQKYNISLANIAERIRFSYRTLLDLRSGNILPSNQILNKIATQFDLDERLLRFKYLSSLRYLTVRNGMTETAAFYLSQLQCDNYTIHDITYHNEMVSQSHLMPRTFCYAGIAINYKATSPNPKVILVEDWSILVKDYINTILFPSVSLQIQKIENYSKYFYSISSFIESILLYGINRANLALISYTDKYRTQNIQYTLVFENEEEFNLINKIKVQTELNVQLKLIKVPNSFDYISNEKYTVLKYSYYLLESKSIFNKVKLQPHINELYESLEICQKALLPLNNLEIEKAEDMEKFQKIIIRFMGFSPMNLSDLLKLEKNSINANNFTIFFYQLLCCMPFLNRANAEKVCNLMRSLLKDLYTSPEYELYLNSVLKRYSSNQNFILKRIETQ